MIDQVLEIAGAVQVCVIMFLLHRVIGVLPALAGLGATIVVVPLTGVVGHVALKLRTDVITKTDARVKLISEIINGAPLLAAVRSMHVRYSAVLYFAARCCARDLGRRCWSCCEGRS